MLIKLNVNQAKNEHILQVRFICVSTNVRHELQLDKLSMLNLFITMIIMAQ